MHEIAVVSPSDTPRKIEVFVVASVSVQELVSVIDAPSGLFCSTRGRASLENCLIWSPKFEL